MKILATQKNYAALVAVIEAAGFKAEDLLAAGDENPITGAIESARQEAAAEVSQAVATAGTELLEALGIAAVEGSSLADTIKEHIRGIEDTAAEATGLVAAFTEALGLPESKVEAADSEEALTSLINGAIAEKTARQLASAGHEPIDQAPGGDAVTDVDVMSLEQARRALDAETDPVKCKKIYNRIQELKASNN